MDLTGKTILVTGGNSGIGRTAALALAAQGATIAVASRSEERTRPVLGELRAANPKAEPVFLQVDLSDLASTRRAAEAYLALGRPLDVLVNNAGVAGGRALSKDGFEITFATNHLGPYLFTRLLLPRRREAPAARIVNVASAVHLRAKGIDWDALRKNAPSLRASFGAYGVSKLMNVLHAKELARRLAGTKVTTYALHPGAVATEVWRELPQPIRGLVKLFLLSVEEGAKTTVHCAAAPEAAGLSGRYWDRCREARCNPLADDPALAAELFEKSDAWIEAALGKA